MAQQPLNTIKNWFRTFKRPTQDQFWDTWDSFWHKDEKLPIAHIEGLDARFDEKADEEAFRAHIIDQDAHHLPELLDAKANKEHKHVMDNVNGLKDALGDLEQQISSVDLQQVTDKSNVTTQSIVAAPAISHDQLSTLGQVKGLIREIDLQSVTDVGNVTTTTITAAEAVMDEELPTLKQVKDLIGEIPEPATLTLQSVTDADNITTKDIRLKQGAAYVLETKYVDNYTGGAGDSLNQFYSPYGIQVDALGNMYITDTGNHRVMKWAPDATEGVVVAGGNGSGNESNQLTSPNGIHVDTSGNIYIVDASNHRIMKWAPGATEGVIVAGGNGEGDGNNQLYSPNSIQVDVAGNIYIANSGNHRIMKWAPDATEGVIVAGGNGLGNGSNQFYCPKGIYVDTSGNMYIADTNNHRIMKWAPEAKEGILVAGGNGYGNGITQFYNPCGIHIDTSGKMYIADTFNHRIMKWTPGATAGLVVAGGNGPGNGNNQLNYPKGIQIDTLGNMYIVDAANHRIQKWAPDAPKEVISVAPPKTLRDGAIKITANNNSIDISNADSSGDAITLTLNQTTTATKDQEVPTLGQVKELLRPYQHKPYPLAHHIDGWELTINLIRIGNSVQFFVYHYSSSPPTKPALIAIPKEFTPALPTVGIPTPWYVSVGSLVGGGNPQYIGIQPQEAPNTGWALYFTPDNYLLNGTFCYLADPIETT